MDGGYLEFWCRTRIVCEEGADAGAHAARLGPRRAFLVADPAVAAGLDALAGSLEAAGVAVAGRFSDVPPDSDVRVVEALAGRMRAAGTELVVVLGGGSAMDTAKAANILLTLGGRLADHEGAGILPDRLHPIVAIPTTAGTGSEVSYAATVYDREAKRKLIFFAPSLACDLAILDPARTRDLPPAITAATGADALTHAIESMMAVNATEFSDAWAAKAVRLTVEHLARAVRDGGDMAARRAMLLAAAAGGIAFSSAGVGIVHAMAHGIGAHCRVHHGTANAILLPHGMRFNLEGVPDRAAGIAEAAGCAPGALVETIAGLLAGCGLPARLREMGVPAERIPDLTEYAVNDGSMAFNPREAGAEEIEALFRAAM